MSVLQQFNTSISREMATTGYSVSGVAAVEGDGPTTLYSASLVSHNKHLPKPSVSDIKTSFQRIRVPGFRFAKCEVLSFISSNSLPKPDWRVQLKYTVE